MEKKKVQVPEQQCIKNRIFHGVAAVCDGSLMRLWLFQGSGARKAAYGDSI